MKINLFFGLDDEIDFVIIKWGGILDSFKEENWYIRLLELEYL